MTKYPNCRSSKIIKKGQEKKLNWVLDSFITVKIARGDLLIINFSIKYKDQK